MWSKEQQEAAKSILWAAWDELAEEEGLEWILQSLQDFVDGYIDDSAEDLDANPAAAEALGIDPEDPTDEEMEAWKVLDREAAAQYLERLGR